MVKNIDFKIINRTLGINMSKAPAFSIKGVWDHNETIHLNIHPFHQILAVQDGVFVIEDNKVRQPLYRCNAAFIPSQVPHRVCLISENSQGVCYSLFFKPEFFKKRIGGIKLFEISNLGKELLRKLNEINLINLTYGMMGRCLNLFLEILNMDIENEMHFIQLPEAKTEIGKNIIKYIEKNYTNNINIHDFASFVAYSPRHTSRIFHEDVGISLFEYLRRYRILMASIQLDKKDTNILDIAFNCGYKSLSSFYSVFNVCYSMTPNHFRKKFFE